MEKKRLAFIIYTYDRYELLNQLLMSISREVPEQFETRVFIFDDCSPSSHIFNEDEFSFSIHYHKFKKNHGKRKWYAMINYIYKFLEKRKPFDFYFFLNDDMEFVENGIQKALQIYKSIDNPKKIALNLHNDRGPSSKWQSKSPKEHGPDLWKVGWTDTSFLCQINFLKNLKWRIPKEDFFKIVRNQDCGSGVGLYISKTLSNKGKRFFLVKKSLIFHKGNHESKMNPKERQKHPLITNL